MIVPRGNIAWVDVETDGLDASNCHLLEIAVLVTDSELNVLDDGFHAVVRYTLSQRLDMAKNASDYVREMHAKTGLWNKLDGANSRTRWDIDGAIRDYLSQHGELRTMPVAGNSVRLDMNFMDKHLPTTAGFLDYHMRDVSTIAGLASDWYDLPWFEKKSDHTAKLDIAESIRELKYYREAIFRNPAEDALLIAAYDGVLNMPQGTMDQGQWKAFSTLFNAVGRVVDRVESHGTLTVSETTQRFSGMPQSQRNEVTADVLKFLVERGYGIIPPGSENVLS